LGEKVSVFFIVGPLYKVGMRFLRWAGVLILSLTVNGLCVRSMALAGVPYYQSLSSRGVFCLVLVLAFARLKKLKLRPKSVSTQFFRALIAGLALSFFTLSYNWLSASAIAVLSNMDGPLLIVLGPVLGMKTSPRLRVLSLISIFFLVLYLAALEPQAHLYLGISTLTVGSALLCFGYLFIKKSMTEENEAITILTPSLAILVFGLVQSRLSPSSEVPWNSKILLEAALSGLTMFGAYYATMRLYSVTNLANAEFPTLIASLVIQPLEAFLLNTPLHPSYLLTSVAFVFVSYLILHWQNQSPEFASV
jgi:drug/metabolite transporter (DMT)-like permease